MVIERTKKEVIIRLPSYIDTEGLQNLINYLTYKEATDKSRAKQGEVNKLVKEIKKDWWKKKPGVIY
jgi:thioredoxin-related protein